MGAEGMPIDQAGRRRPGAAGRRRRAERRQDDRPRDHVTRELGDPFRRDALSSRCAFSTSTRRLRRSADPISARAARGAALRGTRLDRCPPGAPALERPPSRARDGTACFADVSRQNALNSLRLPVRYLSRWWISEKCRCSLRQRRLQLHEASQAQHVLDDVTRQARDAEALGDRLADGFGTSQLHVQAQVVQVRQQRVLDRLSRPRAGLAKQPARFAQRLQRDRAVACAAGERVAGRARDPISSSIHGITVIGRLECTDLR